jgi:putative endonuclease
MIMKMPCVYILATKKYGTLYIGVTSDAVVRVWQHKEKYIDGFTTVHNVNMLVYYEVHDSMYAAISREKQMKKWKRAWKIRQIEEMNPNWDDLHESIL